MSLFRKNKGPQYPWCAAVVAAAGSSSRMEGGDKALMPLRGEPVIAHALRALNESPYIHEIVVVTRQELLVDIGGLCRDYGFRKVTTVLIGGATRLESVYKGVNAVSPKAKLIAIHDGARPLVSADLIARTAQQAQATGAAAPAVPLKDTVKQVKDGQVAATLPREDLRAVQTPQIFDADLIRAALHKAVTDHLDVTDDCSAVERLGATVVLVEGDERNIKITTPPDLMVAEAFLSEAK